MIDYRVAIPSYHRPDRIAQATLPLLKGAGVDMERVVVFLADEQEYDAYQPALRKFGVAANVGHGVTLRAARAAIGDAYPVGTPLVQIDDDVTRFVRRVDAKTAVDVTDLPAVFEEGFAAAHGTLWGVYQVPNPFYMGDRVRAGLWFIDGTFFGYTVRGKAHEVPTLDHGEDYERSLAFFDAMGAVVRLDMYAFKGRIWDEPGGMQDTRTPAGVEEGIAAVEARWPHLVRRHYDKAGRPNLRFKALR